MNQPGSSVSNMMDVLCGPKVAGISSPKPQNLRQPILLYLGWTKKKYTNNKGPRAYRKF